MREIKFRAWDIKGNKMIKQYAHSGTNGQLYICEWPVVEDIELMQFTGLLDKNGKEIYDGDIIDYTGSEIPDDEHNIELVKWSDYPGWMLSSYGMGLGEFCQEELEVIGNIYENPELINQAN